MRSIELFAGAGGLGLGISRSGFTPVEVVEWDQWCCKTLRDNRLRPGSELSHWPEPIESDIKYLNFEKHEGSIDLVTGGPPCQPFSLGGKHRAHDDKRDMWPEAVRVVRETKPKAFIFENVKGLTRSSFASYLAYIVQQLTYPELVRKDNESWNEHLSRLECHHTGFKHHHGLSYNVVYRVLNAADYGIPQRRERIVFVGFRSDLEVEWSFPKSTHSSDSLIWNKFRGDYWERHSVALASREMPLRLRQRAEKLTHAPIGMPWKTVRDAFGDLPDPENSRSELNTFLNHSFQAGARSYSGHTGSPLDDPAKTLKAGVHGVPGGENMLARPDGSVRYFTIRESARLQTFPDDFVFNGSWSESMRQLGNAVPVELALIIAKNVYAKLDPLQSRGILK